MGQVKNTNTVTMSQNDENFKEDFVDNRRHIISIDALSIIETDAVVNDVESKAIGNITFQTMIRNIDDVRQKFVAALLEFGFQSNEIAWMLKVHPSTITRIEQRIINDLKEKGCNAIK